MSLQETCTALALCLSIACGNGSSSSASTTTTTVQGQVNDRAFVAQDAISTQDSGHGFDFAGPGTFVQISDFPGACALEAQDRGVVDGQRLVLALAVNDASGAASPPTSPGVFPVMPQVGTGAGRVAQIYYDGGCWKAQAHKGLSGNVALTRVDADGSLEGTFDIVLTCDGFSDCTGPDAHLIGSFRSTACADLDVNRTPPCQ